MTGNISEFDQIFQDDFIETDREKTVGKYKLGEVLGTGGFSQVRTGHHLQTGVKVAVKCLRRLGVSKEIRQRRLFTAEVYSLSKIRHSSVIRLFETMVTEKNWYLVLEYVDGVTLSKLIKQLGKLDEACARQICLKITSGISYCHDNNVVHRDLKPSNIMVTSNLEVTIIDFGLSVNLEEKDCKKQTCGTPAYTAPEIYSGAAYGAPVDVWSLGVIMFEMLVGSPPFTDLITKNTTNIYANILKRLDIPDSISKDGENLLRQMLTIDATKRISTKNVLQHDWLKIHDKDS